MTSRTRLKSSKKIADYASLFPLLSLLFWLYLKFTHQQNIIISICIYFFEQMLLILNPASKISARSLSDKKELLISTYSPGIVKPTISFCIQYLTHLCALRRLKMIFSIFIFIRLHYKTCTTICSTFRYSPEINPDTQFSTNDKWLIAYHFTIDTIMFVKYLRTRFH